MRAKGAVLATFANFNTVSMNDALDSGSSSIFFRLRENYELGTLIALCSLGELFLSKHPQLRKTLQNALSV